MANRSRLVLNDQPISARDHAPEPPSTRQGIQNDQSSLSSRRQGVPRPLTLPLRPMASNDHRQPENTSPRLVPPRPIPPRPIPTRHISTQTTAASGNWNATFGGLYSAPPHYESLLTPERAPPPMPPHQPPPVRYRAPPPIPHRLSTREPLRPCNIFDSFLEYPELLHELVRNLDIEPLINLYSISKRFRNVVHKRFTATILSQSLTKAPESSNVFLFKCYKSLCTIDPFNNENEEVSGEIRYVPSFRWLRFVLHREKVVDDILECLRKEGHRLPKRTTLTIKKIWFLMDIPDNARRIGLIHNRRIWTNTDLFLATMFFIKLDMRLTHPINGNGETGLRRMLLAQRSLNTLGRALKREALVSTLDMLKMYAAWKYVPSNVHLRAYPVLGVPPQRVGRGQYEGWGRGLNLLLTPDELVMRESVRREMGLHKRYLDMMLWGHVDSHFQDVWPEDEFEERIWGLGVGDEGAAKQKEEVRAEEMELRDSDGGEEEEGA